MGASISGLFLLQAPRVDVVRAALPPSVGLALYVHPDLGVYVIDAFRASKPPSHALASQIPSAELPLELGPHLAVLTDAYVEAHNRRAANGFKRLYVNVAERLSACLGQPVLAVDCDDDESDFACVADQGRLVELTALCGGQIYRFENGALRITPAEDGQELHGEASAMFARFTGKSAAQFGFGSWDPPPNFGLRPLGAGPNKPPIWRRWL